MLRMRGTIPPLQLVCMLLLLIKPWDNFTFLLLVVVVVVVAVIAVYVAAAVKI
jgi:hypothetical protein